MIRVQQQEAAAAAAVRRCRCCVVTRRREAPCVWMELLLLSQCFTESGGSTGTGRVWRKQFHSGPAAAMAARSNLLSL